MDLWLIWVIAGVVFFFIELFTPILFFLNIAVACLITALGAYFNLAFTWQITIFFITSALLLLFLRPFLMKNVYPKNTTMSLGEKYIGKNAKTISPTDSLKGRLTIYGEEWEARSINGEIIAENTDVKIIKNEGTILFVEQI